MRRVDAEGESRGIGGRKQGVAQIRSRLRRASLEPLERRELLSTSTSTLPTPQVLLTSNGFPLSGLSVSNGTALTATANATSPSIAVDPVNPMKMVAAWSFHDATNPLNVGATNTIDAYVEGAFSTDGGVTWTPLPGSDSADVQIDFSASQTSGPVVFTETTDAKVAFGRDESVYLLSSTHNTAGTAGVLDLQRFDFRSGTPLQNLTNNAVYSWDGPDGGTGPDSAQTPVLAVDTSLPVFSDTNASGQTVTQTDPFAGNVYVAWAETDTNTAIPIGNFNPQTIRMVASSDNGTTFTHAAYVDDTSNINEGGSHSGNARYVEPAIAISQGRAPGTLSSSDPGVPGGQVSIVYDDYGTGANASPAFDQIITQTNLVGGTATAFSGQPDTPIGTNGVNVPINVDITDPKFTTLQALDVTVSIAWPALQELGANLVPPPAVSAFLATQDPFYPGFITLFDGDLTGVDMGATTGTGFGTGSGTVFDSTAIRSIADGNTKTPYVGHFQPDDDFDLSLLQGLTASELSGTWTLQVNAAADTTVAPKAVVDSTLNFSSGNDPGFNPANPMVPNPEVVAANEFTQVASTIPGINPTNTTTAAAPVLNFLNNTEVSADPARQTITPLQPVPVLPSPSIASDNTLGAYSQHQGRLYITFTGRFDGAPDASTDIIMLASDDGGLSWGALADAANDFSSGVQVNDDNGPTDGISGTTPGAPSGRTQLQPQVAVDQYTGNVVVSFLDARNDPSDARVATYVAVSNDGGDTFTANIYANPNNTAIDAITGKSVILGPIPDNESADNPSQDAFGFGQTQGLAVADGRIIPVWASNQNAGSANQFVGSAVVDSILTEPGGPRVISSTMGPVGQPGDTVNTLRAADGTPVANSFLVTFDRPIDPATFNPDGPAISGQPIGTGDVRVYYQDPYGATTTGVSTPSSIVPHGTYTSTATVAGQAGVPIVDGRLTLSLTGFTNLGAVTIQLVTPNGQSFTLPAITGTRYSGSYALPANLIGGPVAGQYQLKISDSAGQLGTLSSWSLQVNGLSIGLRVLTITPVPNLSDPLDDGTLGYTTFRVTFDPHDPSNGLMTGVGTYSYVVRPTLSDRIRYVGVPTVSAGTTISALGAVVAPSTGFVTSTIVLSGHPYQDLLDNAANSPTITVAPFPTGNAAGTISAVITGSVDVSTITVFIATPDGERYQINPTSVAGDNLSETFTNVAFAIPYSQLAVDGDYTLEVTDSVGSQDIGIASWSMKLFSKTVTPVLPSATVSENAQLPQLPNPGVPLLGTTAASTSLYMVGHPGQVVGSGTLVLSLTDTNVHDLTITLVGPNNQTFILPPSTGTALNQTYNLPANFVGTTLDGQYQLQIVGLAGDVGQLTSWSLNLVPEGFVAPNAALPSKNFLAFQPVPVPLNPVGTVTSQVSLLEPLAPNEKIGSGQLTVSLALTGNPPGNVISDLTITLTGPGGQTFTVPTAGNNASSLGPPEAVFSLPATFLAGLLNGSYTLSITDNTATDVGQLIFWSIALATEPVTLNPVGTVTSSLVINTILPGEQIQGGTISLSVTNTSIANLTITLTGPGNQTLTIPTGGNTSGSLSETIALPPAFLAGLLSGTYTLHISDNNNLDSGTLASWSIVLTPKSLNGNAMDQNADGTPGQDPETTPFTGLTPGDDYSVPNPSPTTPTTFSGSGLPVGPYASDSLPLIVSGPHVVVTNVTGTGGSTSGDSNNNLIANDQVGSVGVVFDRNVLISSVNSSEVLSLIGPAGPIAGPQTFTSTGISKTFSATTNQIGLLIPRGTGTSLISNLLIGGTGLTLSSLSVTLNITDPQDSSLTLTLISPTGVMVPLAANVGGNGANFSNTTFSDLAPANGLVIPIASGSAPFGLTYQPASPLAALTGLALDGTWQLMIQDNTSPTSSLAQGRLNTWSLAAIPQIPQGAGSSPVLAPLTSLTSSLTIANPDLSFTISHLAVQLNISSPVDQNLTVILVAPDGTKVLLFSGVGGAGSNFSNTTFDDSATVNIANGVAPFNQTYVPISPPPTGFSTLTSLIGKTFNGTWKLEISDSTVAGGSSTLNSWSLIATPQIKITPSETYSSTDTTPTTYVSTDTSTQIYSSVGVNGTYLNPITIPATVGATVTSSIVVPSTGGTFNLANLNIALAIQYPRDTNLSVALVSPGGVTIPLFAGIGGLGANFGFDPANPNGQAFDYTILSDSGSVPISAGIAPFDSGSVPFDPLNTFTIYRPSSPLSVLDGTAIDGTWQLEVTNNSGLQAGHFDGWALIATPQPAPAVGVLPAGSTQPAEPIPVLFAPAQPPPGILSQPLPQPLISSITFPSTNGTYTLASLTTTLTLTAPAGGNLADLAGVLIAPNGAQTILFHAGDGTFTGAGTTVTKTITPLNPISGQSEFANTALDGAWKLEIIDGNQAHTGDVLVGWSLTTTPKPLALAQPAEPVPNTPASSLSTTITIADNVPISDLRLRLNLTAANDSNLSAILIGPNHLAISLFTNVGGSGANFANVVFDDNATTSIDLGTAPFSGTYKPQNPLSDFIAGGLTTIQGQWTLVITDDVPNSTGPSAVLNSWSLINTPPAAATLANSYQINFPTQQLSGTYSLTIGAGILAADPSVNNPSEVSNPSLGTAANPNLNAGVDILKGTSATGVIPTAAITYNAASVPVAIPAAPNQTTTSTLISQIVVPDNFVIQGVTSTGLPGLTVSLNITYPNDPDLTAVLIAPDGTQIPLFTHVGNGSNRANFTSTTLDDTVNPPASIDVAAAPFFGRFNPETPLSDLKGHASGGTWTLRITNRNPADTGTLSSWSLSFQKPLPTSGLGDPVADRQTFNFQIFNIAPTNPLANDTWTAVGPAGITTTTGQNGTFAGSVATVAVDPSDPTGNTVYVGSASGGIWKTTDFLTTNPGGPTYLPVTDFGPAFSLDVGSIAVFGRNSNPDQSVLFAGTGFAAATASYSAQGSNYANYGGNAGRGVGFLRSFDGGQTWSLLDSSVNVDSNGNPLPENSPLRDHIFVGDTTYKVVVDPTPEANGDIIVYAALGGPTGGLYQSLDSGNTWRLLSSTYTNPNTGSGNPFNNAAASDIILDPNSKSPSTGNIDIIYAAFPGIGVFISTNQGQTLTLMVGEAGKDALITGPGFPAQPTAVGNAGVSPNGIGGTIILAKPALTGNAAVDLLYQDWLYAAVETAGGTFAGLYVTKDRGENWTLVQLPNLPGTGPVKGALPTNDNLDENSYDPTSNQFTQNGNYNLTLTIDPTNPNFVYLGGTQDFQESGLIRVDLTDLYDPHNLVSFSNNRDDGGQTTLDSTGAINVANPTTQNPNGVVYPAGSIVPTPYLNFRHAPNTGVAGTSPFNVNATLVVAGAASSGFTNDGTGVTWTPFDEPLKANPGDATGSTNLHDAIAYIDPLTGNVRLIFADDQGVFTALVNPDGTLDNGIGTDASANYSRNGNLQDEQFYYGAAQPSNLAAQAAGALFYASGQGILAAQSDPNILNNGDITWDDSSVVSPNPLTSPRVTAANSSIVSSDRSGVGIATDPTGGATVSSPTGTGPSVYEFDVPGLGGNLTDFFRVNQVGQTTGLAGNVQTEFPFGNARASGTSGNDLAGAVANGQIPLGNFTVNPLNGSQILIGSATGRLYETTNKGVQWLPIGQPDNFDSTQISAITYGAPDPSAPSGVGNLNNFIYVGTVGGVGTTPETTASGGHIFVTRTGGQGWTDISSGLDGGSVIAIYTNPNRGSHEAYAVTLNGVFYSPDTIGLSAAGQTVWTNITGNLAQIQGNPFGNALLGQSVLATFQSNSGGATVGTAQYGGFTSIVADYRYDIPDATGAVHPVLYVSGYGGVFRSLDNGQTWTVFPNTAFDSAPVDGGYLPSVDVTGLQLNLGAINPTTGHASQVVGDPEVLLATTFGRGAFAIRLAPDVFPNTISLDPNLPAPGGSDSGTVRGFPNYTNVTLPYIDGTSEVSNFGNTVTITLIDEANGDIIGTGTTDAFGHFQVQVGTFVDPNQVFDDPSFLLDGVKNIGIQATDSSGAKGNITTFTYNLKQTPPLPPANLTLTNDSGRVHNDDISNLVPPVFTVNTTEPVTTAVELIRLVLGSTTQYEVVGTEAAGVNPVTLTDNLLVSELNGSLINQSLTYYAIQIDLANNFSTPLSAITTDPTKLTVTLDNVPPPAPTSLSLDPSTNSGTNPSQNVTNFTNPLFDVTGLLTTGPVAPYNLELFRSIGGSTPILVGTAAPGVTKIRDTVGVPADGVYVYQVAQVDLAGNVSPLSTGIGVTINTQVPAMPTLLLFAADDSGAPTHTNVTNVTDPRFNGVGSPGLPIILFNSVTGQGLAATTVAANGTYLVQIIGPIADGTYTLVARITNAAGNSSLSAPLTITIKASGPQVVPALSIFPADDTGLKGDGVTANHRPRFTGVTDPGDLVTLYALVNGQLSPPQATTIASTVNGSFTFQLPFSLTNGTTQLVAQATDIAGNVGPLSSPFAVRIVNVPGDYYDTGIARLTVFNPLTETYTVQNAGSAQVDTTPGRDVPIQYDFNGDGSTDLVGYRYNSAEYFGTLSDTSALAFFFGQPGVALPVSGTYGGTGTFIYAAYNPPTSTWYVALPQPGGEVVQFGAPKFDVPAPAAYDGGGITEIATFRPVTVAGGDADSFNVASSTGYYQISFSSPAVTKLGFTYKPGDIPAPADYDGVGKDEFAIYRPSTGQFFILKTPNVRDSSTWSLRTVTLNLPGGPNVNDVPVSEDYDGNGKIDPTVYRPSNSTFYMIHSSTGIQQNIPFGTPGGSIAAAGPLLYRLSALQGQYASNGGYPGGTAGSIGGTGTGGGGGGGSALDVVFGNNSDGGGSASFHALSFAAAANTSTSSTSTVPSLIAVASPMPVATTTLPLTPITVSIPQQLPVTVGASTPKTGVATVTKSHHQKTVKVDHEPVAKVAKAKKPATAVKVDHKLPVVETKTKVAHAKVKPAVAAHKSSAFAAAAMALQKLVLANKGKHKA
jgi:subtilisin-like proprotein convertase family protein